MLYSFAYFRNLFRENPAKAVADYCVITMLELELILNDLRKIQAKEKGLRNRILLEKAVDSLKEYEKAVASGNSTIANKKIISDYSKPIK